MAEPSFQLGAVYVPLRLTTFAEACTSALGFQIAYPQEQGFTIGFH